MSKRRVTIQITLDLRAVALLSVLLLLLGFIILPAVAGAFPRDDDPEPQTYDANNADKVDGLHASKRPKANTLLALNRRKKFPARVIPAYTKAQSNARFLNDDRQETIEAAVAGSLLTVNNTGSGSSVNGLEASAEDRGVYGKSTGGIGVQGDTTSGTGVLGSSISGTAVWADAAGSGLALRVESYEGDNLIEAYDGYMGLDKLRFQVTRSGDVYIDALLMVGQYSSAPTCSPTTEGSIYYDTTKDAFYGCDGSTWQAFH